MLWAVGEARRSRMHPRDPRPRREPMAPENGPTTSAEGLEHAATAFAPGTVDFVTDWQVAPSATDVA